MTDKKLQCATLGCDEAAHVTIHGDTDLALCRGHHNSALDMFAPVRAAVAIERCADALEAISLALTTR